MPTSVRLIAWPFALMIAIAIAGCGAAPSGAPPGPPPAVVEAVAATASTIDEVIEQLGTVAAVDAVSLSVKSAGIVTTLAVEDGARVERGALLVELDHGEAAGALLQAQVIRDNLARSLKIKQPLLESKAISVNEFDELRSQLAAAEAQVATAQSRFDDRRVVAPFSGRLGLRQVSIGALLSPGTVVTTLVSMAPVKLLFSVPETHLARLKPGLTVTATAPTFGGRVFTGTVSAIDSVVDPVTRAIVVQALLPNEDEALRPGLSMSVSLVIAQIADAVTVPEEAVQLQGDQAAVMRLVQADGTTIAKRAVVRLGRRSGGRVHIVEGLAPGDQVVVQGPLMLRDGAPVQLRTREAGPAKPPAAAAKPAPAAGGR